MLENRIGIFECNGSAVVSPEPLSLGNVSGEKFQEVVVPETKASKGKYGVDMATTNSWLNAQTFINIWDALILAESFVSYDFVVKTDADTVFFPHRLRSHIVEYIGEAVFFANCDKFTDLKLWGSVEVFSAQAMIKYSAHVNTCKALPWRGWGEDGYMEMCMERIKVRKV